ncbi:SNARE-like superfamily protein, partial [Prunus dulcis]
MLGLEASPLLIIQIHFQSLCLTSLFPYLKVRIGGPPWFSPPLLTVFISSSFFEVRLL